MLHTISRMRFNKSLIKLSVFLWILLLYQISETSCATLRNYSLKTLSDTHLTMSTNLSDLIEYTPLNSSEVENITVVNHKVKDETTPKVVTFKFKTHLIVRNPDTDDESVLETYDGVKTLSPNASESSLSDIEYVNPSEDDEFWQWNSNRRSRKLNNFLDLPAITKNNTKSKTASEESFSRSTEIVYDSEDSAENQISEPVYRSKLATGRQFVFHPYLPYGKDTPPDEKITFDDILPVKMVKFIKSMVEEAPWEQMFMKMVRMIVDQFVDKIIEKMFADKGHDDHFKKRSFEILLSPTLVLPTFHTPVVRLKRSVASKTIPEDDDDFSRFLPPKKMEQDASVDGKKSAAEKKTWLDHFLDFVFPNSKSDLSDEDFTERLRKRDTTNNHFLKALLKFFLTSFEKSSGFITDAKDVLRYKMLKEFLPYLYQKRYMNGNADTASNSVDEMRMSHRKIPDNVLKRNDEADNLSGSSPTRSKRSAEDHSRKDDEDRLWQSHSRRHRPQHRRSHDECSLRRACNAGRMLSGLPSVQEITLQLRSDGNEPHWDALLWGMKKKRCSRIFCKRQRSPKGSRSSWNRDDARSSRKIEMVTELPDAELDLNNNLTI